MTKERTHPRALHCPSDFRKVALSTPMNLVDKISEFAYSAATRLTVRSALNPLLWMCATVGVTCFATAYVFRNDLFVKVLLVIVGVLPILITCVVAVFFAFCKPDKLQSEEYQLRQQTLSMIEEKGGRIKVDVVSLEQITNPPKPDHFNESELEHKLPSPKD
jgi:hypothetical protein